MTEPVAPATSRRAPGPRALPQVGGASPLPPYALPASHFFAALAWATAAVPMLIWLAPRLAEGRVFDPPVLALMHMLILGVVASGIFGALNQFVPGGLGVPLRSARVGMIGFWLLQLGVLTLVAGFWVWHGALQGLGWVLVFAAVGAVSYNTLRARRQSVHGRLVGLFVTVSHSALGAGMGVALARIGETMGWWQVDRLSLLASHAMLGAVGFGTLAAVGVGSRMLPTFLLGPGDDTRWLHTQLALASAGLVLFPVGAILVVPLLMHVGSALLVASGVVAVLLGWRWFSRRHRTLDAALWHVAAAFVALGLAVLVGASLAIGDGFDLARWAALMVLLVVGWLGTLLFGVMAKILTHLSYNSLLRSMPGFAAFGTPNLLLRSDWQHASAALLSAGWCMLAMSLTLHHASGARAAAVVWGAGVVLSVANWVRMFVRGRWPGDGGARRASPGAATGAMSIPG